MILLTEPEELLVLTADVIDDEELLGGWVDNVIRLDAVAEARRISIDEWRGWLQEAADPDAWKLVLDLDRRVTERWADLGCVLVRYGFEAGRRHPREAGEVER